MDLASRSQQLRKRLEDKYRHKVAQQQKLSGRGGFYVVDRTDPDIGELHFIPHRLP